MFSPKTHHMMFNTLTHEGLGVGVCAYRVTLNPMLATDRLHPVCLTSKLPLVCTTQLRLHLAYGLYTRHAGKAGGGGGRGRGLPRGLLPHS